NGTGARDTAAQEHEMTKPMHGLRKSAVLALAAALAGCTVGPDFRQPEAPRVGSYTETPLAAQTEAAPAAGRSGAAQRFATGEPPADWWTLFRSEALDRLVREGLAHSPTLDAARATLRQAQENYSAARGGLLYPGVNGSVAGSREKVSGEPFAPGALGPFNLY